MKDDANEQGDVPAPAMRYLVESALRQVKSSKESAGPRTRDEWVAALCEALMSDSEASHHAVLSSLIASGVTMEQIHQVFVPAAARYLGELWVSDDASFVDVTVAAGRLQSIFRARANEGEAGAGRWVDRTVPLGHSVLMVIPEFEQHTLGAFVAADKMRRHNIWVRMAIGLEMSELTNLISNNRFSMVGLTAASSKSVEKSAHLVDHLRSKADHLPPLVLGGSAVDDKVHVQRRTGVDFAVKSAREAVEKCSLACVEDWIMIDETG